MSTFSNWIKVLGLILIWLSIEGQKFVQVKEYSACQFKEAVVAIVPEVISFAMLKGVHIWG